MNPKQQSWLTLFIAPAIVGLVLLGAQYMLQSKNLSIKVAAKSQLSVYGADKAPEIQVSVNGSSLESPYLTYINVGYSGGQALTIDDFKTPRLDSTNFKVEVGAFSCLQSVA